MTAAEVTPGDVVELPCGCIGQRATAPISAEPQFMVKASCDMHAPWGHRFDRAGRHRERRSSRRVFGGIGKC
jgi:hypothetical protein